MSKRKLIVIAHNMRSYYNVGSLLRTAEGLGVHEVYLTGYTPHPSLADDKRLPHEKAAADKQIAKTSLGAEKMIKWQYYANIQTVITQLREQGYVIAGLEQASGSLPLADYPSPDKLALILGNEVAGMDQSVMNLCDSLIEIPMRGQKESFNVVQAAAIALYHLTYL